MKFLLKIKESLTGLTNAIIRYPITITFLIAAAVVNGISIETGDRWIFIKLLATFLIGAFLAVTAQSINERFFQNNRIRWILYGIVVIFSGVYFLIIGISPEFGMDVMVKTAVILFALLVAFIWIPSIKKEISFNETFIAAFKSFFVALFYGIVIFAGISIILGVSDVLLINVYENLYGHVGNIVFILFFPLYFLSLIPKYSEADKDKIEAAFNCPKFLEVLISYIIIPLISIFTAILLVYIAINLGGNFWSQSLIEPMLVSYSIIVIIVSILSQNLMNKFASLFKKIFPKVLIPLVLFQVVASILKIGDMGVTHGRYYVILYGVFAVVAGVVFSFLKPSKTGIIAIVFICFSILSTIPPIDAFNISRLNQIATLENTLQKNDMLKGNEIVPNSNISDHDKLIISNTVIYLSKMSYSKDIVWLGDDFEYYDDFNKVFGFDIYDMPDFNNTYSEYIRKSTESINIEGYDLLVSFYYSTNDKAYSNVYTGIYNGKTYKIKLKDNNIYIKNDSDSDLLVFDMDKITDKFSLDTNTIKDISTEEATVTMENDDIALKIIINRLDSYMENINSDKMNVTMELYVLVDIKDQL